MLFSIMQPSCRRATPTAQEIKKILGRCEWYELAVHKETFETTLFAAGPQLKVGPLLVVYV
jgi:hypothetical protein